MGLKPSSSKRMRAFFEMHLTVYLTIKGEENVHSVIEYIFMFINKLKKEEP